MSIKYFAISAIHHFAKENYSRQEGNAFKNNDERVSLAKLIAGKWDHTRDGAVLTLEELTAAEVELAVSERVATWKFLKESNADTAIKVAGAEKDREITVSAGDMLVSFENTYVNKGKIIAPKYRGMYAFRRFAVIVLANALAKKLEKPEITEVPATMFENKDEKGNTLTGEKLDRARKMVCIAENTKKNDGVHILDWRDIMRAAYNLFISGCSQNNLRDLFKDGTGQKLWWLLQLNNIIVTPVKDEVSGETKNVYGGLVEAIVNGFKVSKPHMKVKAVFDELVPKVETDAKPTLAEVQEALETEASVTALSGNTVKNLSKNSPILLVREMLNAVVTGNADYFTGLSKDSAKVVALNEFYDKFKAMK